MPASSHAEVPTGKSKLSPQVPMIIAFVAALVTKLHAGLEWSAPNLMFYITYYLISLLLIRNMYSLHSTLYVIIGVHHTNG